MTNGTKFTVIALPHQLKHLTHKGKKKIINRYNSSSYVHSGTQAVSITIY